MQFEFFDCEEHVGSLSLLMTVVEEAICVAALGCVDDVGFPLHKVFLGGFFRTTPSRDAVILDFIPIFLVFGGT